MTSHLQESDEQKTFGEFRRKVKSAEVLSASMEHLLMTLRFTGKLCVMMQNGRVLKSGYEESYFHQGRGGAAEEDGQRSRGMSGGT